MWRADELAASIPPEDRKELRRGDQRQCCFTCTLHVPKVNHKLPIVIVWNHRRNGPGQTRRMYLPVLAYSLLMRQLRQERARDWALCRLKTIGEACRAMLNGTLRATRTWVIQQAREYENPPNHLLVRLRLA